MLGRMRKFEMPCHLDSLSPPDTCRLDPLVARGKIVIYVVEDTKTTNPFMPRRRAESENLSAVRAVARFMKMEILPL